MARYTQTLGHAAHAEGFRTVATLPGEHAEGYATELIAPVKGYAQFSRLFLEPWVEDGDFDIAGPSELRVAGGNQALAQRITVPLGFTFLMTFNIVHVSSGFAVSTWNFIAACQNSNEAASNIGDIYPLVTDQEPAFWSSILGSNLPAQETGMTLTLNFEGEDIKIQIANASLPGYQRVFGTVDIVKLWTPIPEGSSE